MQSVRNPRPRLRPATHLLPLFAAFVSALFLAGCGMPGAPLPPSLNLPVPVTDLSAVRTGSQVALAWTMPTKTTDKVLLKGNIAVQVCRNRDRRIHLLNRRHTSIRSRSRRHIQ